MPDYDETMAHIDEAIEDWETSGDAATWTADGSHEHDPPPWTRVDMAGGWNDHMWDLMTARNGRHYIPTDGEALPEGGELSVGPLPALVTWDEDQLVVHLRGVIGPFVTAMYDAFHTIRDVLVGVGHALGEIIVDEAKLYREADEHPEALTVEHIARLHAVPTEMLTPRSYTLFEPLELPEIRPGDRIELRHQGRAWTIADTEALIERHNERTRPAYVELNRRLGRP